MEKLLKQLDFIVEADKLKNIMRQTLLMDKSRKENDAEHTFHICLCALILKEYSDIPVCIDRVIKMLLVHDLVEIYAGDTPALDTKANLDKEKRENEAAQKLYSILPKEQNDELHSLWREFEEMKTSDSKFANACDRFQPFLHNVKTDGYTWVGFNATKVKIYNRVGIIKEVSAKLWEYVEEKILWGIEMGYIKEE